MKEKDESFEFETAIRERVGFTEEEVEEDAGVIDKGADGEGSAAVP